MTNDNSDSDSEVYQVQYGETGYDALLEAIIRATGAITGNSHDEVPPLYDTVDVDALEQLLRSLNRDGEPITQAKVEFSYQGCRISAFPDGRLKIHPPHATATD